MRSRRQGQEQLPCHHVVGQLVDVAHRVVKRRRLQRRDRFGLGEGVGGELIRASPDNEEYAQAVLQVLNRRLETLDGDYVVLSERPLRAPRELPSRATVNDQNRT